ncbi:hypothetical protein MD484_g7515, partial [Candolleomyces efflorescens]
MAGDAAFFAGAHRFSIRNSQFNTHQTVVVRSSELDPALQILHTKRALEACHTSKTAANAAKCKEGTQVEVIEDITTWVDDVLDDPDPPPESILWLRGPAGGGKTCILRTVAEIYDGKRRLAGVYFFSTRVPGLDNEAPFIATLASYLIEAIPALDEPVLQTIRSHPTIFDQSLEYQLEKLVSNHIRSIPPESLIPRLLIIDGFDECRDPKERAHLLRIVHSLVTPPHCFRVIMASRPEFDIRTAFGRPPLKSVTKILRLESYDTSEEIYRYLADEFARIRETHPAKDSIPLGWPGQDTLQNLTGKSSGIWAYPSTVIKYVDNPRRHPVEQLKQVIDASSSTLSGRPFAELDALYEIVLDPPDTDIPLMKRLLHIVIECQGKVECCRLCASLRRMVEYRHKLREVIVHHEEALPMERLKIFEEECRSLFDEPLDLSPLAAIAFLESDDCSSDLDNELKETNEESEETDEESGVPLPSSSDIPSASESGDVPMFPPPSTSTVNEPKAPQSNLPSIDDSICTVSNSHFLDPTTATTTIQDSSLTSPPETSSERGSGELTGVCLTPELITTTSPSQLPNPTTPTQDDVSAAERTPPGKTSPDLGTGEVASVGLAPEPIVATSRFQASSSSSSSTPISSQDKFDASSETLPRQIPSELGSGQLTGVHLTPESPEAVNGPSVGLASIFVWLAVPVIVVALSTPILRRT